MSILRFCLRVVSIWGLLVAVPLFAQLSPKWQTNASADFLDLYQQSNTTSVKPELATLLDFSGSMHRGMFHSLFPNDWSDEDRNSDKSRYFSIFVRIKLNSGHYSVDKIRFGYDDASPITFPANNYITITDKKYYIEGTLLIKPDGNAVTEADVTNHAAITDLYASNTATRASHAMNWIRCASHARMVLTQVGTTTLSTVRTIDFPLPWALIPTRGWAGVAGDPGLRNPAGDITNPSPGNTHPYTISFPLPRVRLKDKDNTWYDMDSTYMGTLSDSVQLKYCHTTGTTEDPLCAYIGHRNPDTALYRGRYIEWVFLGKDGANNFIVPDAVLSGSYWFPDDAKFNNVADPQNPVNSHTFKTGATGKAFANGLPNRTRLQAVKEAFLATWVRYQDKVLWAFRALSYSAIDASSNISTATNGTAAIPVPTVNQNNNQFGVNSTRWYLLNGNSAKGIQYLAKVTPSGSTPLTRSHANIYAQLQNTSPFDTVQTGDGKPVECMQHFVILFTDGAPNESGSPINTTPVEALANLPYRNSASGVYDGASKGNAAVATAGLTSLDPRNTCWNSPTLAGVAAHGFNRKLGVIYDPSTYNPPAVSGKTSAFAPFWIRKRGSGTNALTYAFPHPIQTMTVGVSMGATYSGVTAWPIPVSKAPVPIQNDPTGSKFRLLASATFGDPDKPGYDIYNVKPFYIDQAKSQEKGKPIAAEDSAYFFDARDPEALTGNLEAALSAALGKGGKYATAAPNFPTIGAGLGNQVYLAKFQAPDEGGPVWEGDLRMFPTVDVAGKTSLVQADGTPILDLDAALYGWSGKMAILAKTWTGRNLLTRLESTAAQWNPSLVPLSVDGSNYLSIKNWLKNLTTASPYYSSTLRVAAVANDDATLKKHLSWAMGANIYSTATPLPTRNNIMGDIINSSPAVIEYSYDDFKSKLPPSLASAPVPVGKKPRFRVIFTGTNQGFLHAFGEVSWTEDTLNGKLSRGKVDELWAFLPTDILPFLDYYQNGGNKHRFAVDGPPKTLFEDQVPTGKATGNGKVDLGEPALVVFGLGKGGRSYYAIDISDPTAPKIGGDSKGWALVPDEPTNYPASRFMDAADTASPVIKEMGYATTLPEHGMVISGNDGLFRRMVFLGGGLSVPEIELNYPTTGANTKLGRSAMALDAYSGQIKKLWNISTLNAGPVSAGLVPMDYFTGSGLVQRAYFADQWGGVWVLGSLDKIANGPYKDFRKDTSKIEGWSSTPRKLFGGSLPDNRISTTVVPFRIGNFFPLREITNTDGSKFTMAPKTVGVAFVTGDRNNPLDLLYNATTPLLTKPSQHALTVLFDREDGPLFGLDTSGINVNQIQDMSTAPSATVLDPNHASFYLKNKHGYFINLPPRDNSGFVPKGITPPVVLGGVAFWSYFSPAEFDPCTGGQGKTYTNRLCDILRPRFPGNGTTVTAFQNLCESGQVLSWYGVASQIVAKTASSVLQVGLTVPGSGSGGGSATPATMDAATVSGNSFFNHANPRTWRTIR